MDSKIKIWKEVIDIHLPFYPITEETRQKAVEYAMGHPVGSARAAAGRLYTDKEWKERKARVLSTPLP